MKTFCLRTLLTLTIVVLASSCVESKELTRARALSLIREAKEFKKPISIAIRSGDTVTVEAKAADELEQEAQARAVEAYLDNHPVMAVLNYLRLIEVKADVTEKPKVIKAPEIIVNRPNGTVARSSVGNDRLEPWKFLIRTNLTGEGKKVAREDDHSILLYTKEVIEVTGITNSAGRVGQAQAEFTWRAVPTSVGEAFDPTSQTYKNLPAKLQQALRQPVGSLKHPPFTSTSEIDSSIRKGAASFQRYDDGWRLLGIQ
jgi:hypothetical protein